MTRRTLILLLPLLATLPALLGSPPLHADEAENGRPVRLLTSYALTPDGGTLVFAWRGDLWRVCSRGGVARRLTSHPARDTRPRISPDGTRIAFLSNRDGSDQVFVMPLSGGSPTQVTLHSEGFQLYGWFPDGKALLVRARLDHDWRRPERFFRRPLDAEAPLELLFDAYGSSASLSPDGRTLAFTREGVHWARKGYRGSQASQVWLCDLETKTFRKLTEGDHEERWPLWTPDGEHLYVTSEENGTFNLWEVDRAGDERRQRTFFEDDGVLLPAISADGSTIVFRHLFDLWRLEAATDGEPVPIEVLDVGDPTVDPVLHRTLTKATAVDFTDDAREIAFVAGGDVWVMDTELREPKRITKTPEEEREPLFSPDFETLTFLSDAGGQPDVWVARRADEDRFWWQNDSFRFEKLTDDEDVEQWISFTPDGKRIALVKGSGNLWTMKPDGSDAVLVVASWDQPSYSFSPDGRWVAYAVTDTDSNRDVWIRSADGTGEPFNVSRHPDTDMRPTWSPDGRLLAFTGRRWRDEQDICFVWLRKVDEEESRRDRTLEKALEKMGGRKKKSKDKGKTKGRVGADEPGPGDEPEPPPEPMAPADRVAGTWMGSVRGEPPFPPAGIHVVLDLQRAEDGSLSGHLTVPDVFSGPLVGLEIDEDAGSLTFSIATPYGTLVGEATIEGNRMQGTWSVESVTKGTFELTRKSLSNEPEAPVGKDAKGKEPKPVEIDFDGLEDRIHRISIPDAAESRLMWSPDSKKLAFQTTINGARGLYTVAFPDDLKPKKLTSTVGTWGRWLKNGNQIVWLVSGLPATMSASGKAKSYSFRVNQAVDLAARNAAAFDQVWRILRDTWYDERLNNRDWDAVYAKYRPMAVACVAPEEIDSVVTMMLGELNGSHVGFHATSKRWSRSGWREVTRHLGVRFDTDFEGPGLRVKDVIPRTTADQERHRLEPGDVLLSIDGTAVGPATRLAHLLAGPADEEVEIEVRGADGAERTLCLRPTSYGAARAGLYDAWVERGHEAVARASEGRLGYLHVRGMNWSSFEGFEADLYRIGHGKEGLIIDVRDNGGGFTADHLLTVLTQPRHAVAIPRGGPPGYPQDRLVYARWWKPIVVLCNQKSFSNAEIFAHAIRTLGRGPIVGVPTAGGVISTGGTSIMDVGSLRLPSRGWFVLPTGEDMEGNGCVPDHVVWPEPGEMPAGKDRQLEKAVEVLLEEVRSASGDPLPLPRFASERISTDDP